ncbi:MAG: VanZ family protein, partial [Clostridia bacterium]|nr:VanZ family protein [Clostridia bacterium]
MKKPNKWWIYALLTLSWTGVIFAFSLQPANASANLSGGLLQRLLNLWYQWTNLQIPVDAVHRLFRKVAHFGEFFVLGTFAFFWFHKLKKSRF